MSVVSSEINKILSELGLSLEAGQVEMTDMKCAESCYIHHTRAPVAMVGFAAVSPSFAQGRLPKFSFLDLIAKRPSMDEYEACAFAAICGAEVNPPFWGNPGPFGKHVWAVIERYELSDFFTRLEPEQAYGKGSDHYLLRPRGDTEEADSAILKEWRTNYKKLPQFRQLLVASIVRLYNSNETHWLIRVPKKWHAAEGIKILRDHDALADWGRLVALYPGW